MYDVAILGAGAAGMMCAAVAGQRGARLRRQARAAVGHVQGQRARMRARALPMATRVKRHALIAVRIDLTPIEQFRNRCAFRRIFKSNTWGQFQGDFLFSAMYLNELLCRIWPQDVGSDQLFALYQHSIQALEAAQ